MHSKKKKLHLLLWKMSISCCLGDYGFGNVDNNYKIAMDRQYRDRDTEADLTERKALGSVL